MEHVMRKIDINCDMGESYGRFTIGNDASIMPFISSCNIACGFHGGDPTTIWHTIHLAIDHQVKIGAHPSYPDLSGFGRRTMQMKLEDLKTSIIYQVAALYTMVKKSGGRLHHVKVHGALYNDAIRNEEIAMTILEAIQFIDPELVVFTLPGSIFYDLGIQQGMSMWGEAFADRRYHEDGTLVDRNNEGAVIYDAEKAANQVLEMVVHNTLTTLKGKKISIHPDTICIHGDTQGAVNIATIIYQKLHDAGIQVA